MGSSNRNYLLNRMISVFIGLILLLSCKEPQQNTRSEIPVNEAALSENLILQFGQDSINGFKWLNAPKHYVIENDYLLVTAPKNSDFFINPVDLSSSASAPFLYREISGDFVAISKVSPDLSSKWNAAAFMVMINSENWIKFAFENSDATGPSIVSVVTKGTSDDANGAILNNTRAVWLKITRKGNNYAMHWSVDGLKYHMARLSAMPKADTVKLGLEAQCPVGVEALHRFDYLSIKSQTVEDLRTGN